MLKLSTPVLASPELQTVLYPFRNISQCHTYVLQFAPTALVLRTNIEPEYREIKLGTIYAGYKEHYDNAHHIFIYNMFIDFFDEIVYEVVVEFIYNNIRLFHILVYDIKY